MSSNPSPMSVQSKSSNITSQPSPPVQYQFTPPTSGESFVRRGGGPGSLGAGATTRTAAYAPRNNQAARKQNKSSRRSRLSDEDAFAESAAMKSTTSRKGQTSITHLMNFTLPPRPQYHHQHTNHGRNARPNRTWGLGSGYHAVDKARQVSRTIQDVAGPNVNRYVHANYRFIVDPNGDYRAQSVDADIYLDWSKVLQILASPISQDAACPICLGTPVAPRMAKCGHIFCLPCLIRYMHSTDESSFVPEKKARWKKCPICFDSIYISDTRPLRWFAGQEPAIIREGGDVVLRLVKREAGNTLALPRDGADALAKEEDIPWYLAAEVMDYARVMKGSEDYMTEQFEAEIEELQKQEREDELMFGESTEWTSRAVRAIEESKERVKGIGNPPSMPIKPVEDKAKRPPIKFNEPDGSVPDMYLIQQATKSGASHSSIPNVPSGEASETPSTDFLTSRIEGSPLHSMKPRNPSSVTSDGGVPSTLAQFRNRHGTENPPSEYYFYQALLHYYLSPLDIRILRAAFGPFPNFPSTILPRLDRISTGHIVDDDLRKRTRYLAHLPYGCEVGFLECYWTDIVSPDILEKFKPEIERRRKKNQDKEAREEKERLRAEKEEEDKRYASARRKRPSVPEDRFLAADFQPLVTEEVQESAVSVDEGSTSTSPPWPARRAHGSAFASLASPSTSPAASRTVWGTAAIAPTSPLLQAPPPQEEDPVVDDGWLHGWETDFLGEGDLVAQIQAASLGECSRAGAAAGPSKKKKGKKITLMTTNARRAA